MRTAEEIIADHVFQVQKGKVTEEWIEKEWVIACMKQYAIEVIDKCIDLMWDEWRADTSELIALKDRLK